jgi:hypothetical protein
LLDRLPELVLEALLNEWDVVLLRSERPHCNQHEDECENNRAFFHGVTPPYTFRFRTEAGIP